MYFSKSLDTSSKKFKKPQTQYNKTTKPKEAIKHQLFIGKSNQTPAVCKQVGLITIPLFLLMQLKIEIDFHILEIDSRV